MTTIIERTGTELVPEIENDITRREFLIWTGGILVLAPYGCGSNGEGADEATSRETRTVEHALDEAKAAYEEHADEVAGKIVPALKGREVATLRIEPGTILAYGPNMFTGTVLADARVPRPEPPAGVKETFGYYEVSPELLPGVDGDIIFVYFQEPGAVDELTANPLWDDLPAVQNDLAFAVDFEHWVMRVGYSASNAILGDLEKYLAEREGGS